MKKKNIAKLAYNILISVLAIPLLLVTGIPLLIGYVMTFGMGIVMFPISGLEYLSKFPPTLDSVIFNVASIILGAFISQQFILILRPKISFDKSFVFFLAYYTIVFFSLVGFSAMF